MNDKDIANARKAAHKQLYDALCGLQVSGTATMVVGDCFRILMQLMKLDEVGDNNSNVSTGDATE